MILQKLLNVKLEVILDKIFWEEQSSLNVPPYHITEVYERFFTSLIIISFKSHITSL